MINRNSIEVWNERIKPNLTEAQKSVIRTMKMINRPATIEEIAKVMDKQVNEISGRFLELIKLGEIIIEGKKKNSRGNNCSLYKINNYKLF